MKIVFILVLCLTQALCDPFVLLASKIAARKNPEDDFVGVVKGQPQSTVESTTKSEPEAEHPADKVDATKEVVHTTTTTDQVPPPPPQPATTTSTTETTQKTDTTQTASYTAPNTTDQTTTTTTTTTTAKKDESEVPLEGHGDTTVAQPEAEKVAATEKPKEETTVSKEETTTTKTSTDADVLNKLKDLKERVEKLENEETQKADYGKGSGGAPSTTSTNNNIVPVSSNYVNTANGPAPKYYDGNGVPHPGQIIGVSPFGVANPLIGVGAPDPSNKQKYNSIDVGKALNTDTTEISTGKGVAEQADQAHKDFLDENTEEFERIMSWLQEQQHLLPKQHQPPKLLFQILKERIMIQEQKVLSQMLEKQQVPQPQQQPQQPSQLLQDKSQKLAAFPNLHIVAYDNNNPAPGHGNTNTIIE